MSLRGAFEAIGDDPLDSRRLSNSGSHRSSEAAQIHTCCNQTGPGGSQNGGIKFFWMAEDNGLAGVRDLAAFRHKSSG